jgi:hypothetical protein
MQNESRRFVLSMLKTQCQAQPNRMRLVALGQDESPAESNVRGVPRAAASNPQTYLELFRFGRAA